MQAYAALLAQVLTGSPEQAKAADLLQGLRKNAMESLLEVLAKEAVQSTRRKLLDVLATVAPMHVETLAASVSHPEWYVVRNVIWIMGRVGPAALPHIRKVSSHR